MKRLLLLPLLILTLCSCCTGKSGKKKADLTPTNPCLEAVEKIVTTSPKFREFTKDLSERVIANGGTGFAYSLEGSPAPDAGVKLSDMYDYKVTEEYADRSHVVARFSFDPRKELLYEYDAIENAHNKIAFDHSLLPALRANCGVPSYEGEAYILSEGKLYLMNLADKSREELAVSDKPVMNFALSPSQQYIAFEKELSNIDCRPKTLLVFYDLARQRAFQELGGKDGLSGFIARWEGEEAVYSLTNEEKEVYNYYKTSVRTGNTTRISEEAYFNTGENDSIANPYDKEWAVTGDGEQLTLVNTRTNKETVISSAADNRKLRDYTVQWLDHSRFVYASELMTEAQCAPRNYDIYLYNITTNNSTLIVKGVSEFRLKTREE